MRAISLVIVFLLTAFLSARAEPVDAGHATAEIISERSQVVPGDRFLAGLKLVMDKDWHVYWRNAGDAGIAPSIRWDETVIATTGEFTWPAPHTIPLEGLMNYGYGEEVVLPFEVAVPEGMQAGEMLVLSGKAEWQICLDVCIWEDAELSLTLPVGNTPQTLEGSADDIANALLQAPKDLMGKAFVERDEGFFRLGLADTSFAEALKGAQQVRFFPFEHEIEHFPEQALSFSDNGGVLTLEVASFGAPQGAVPLSGVVVVDQADHQRVSFTVNASPGTIPADLGQIAFSPGSSVKVPESNAVGLGQLLVWLGLGALGGLILNLMPCVLPVLTIKANGLIHAASEGEASIKMHGLAYFAGVIVCFLGLGAIVVALRAAGDQTGLGFQLQYPPVVLALSFLMFLIGLNLLGVFEIGTSLMGAGGELTQKQGAAGAFFTGLLAAVVGAPCVGPVMAGALGAVVTTQPAWIVLLFMFVMGAGMAAPFLLLSFAPGLARSIPKPGRWMDTLKQFLAFPMFLTAVGLLWVFAGQAGADMTILALAGAVVVVMGIWLLKRSNGAMFGRVLGGTVLALGLLAPVIWSGGAVAPTAIAKEQPIEGTVERIAWSPETVQQLRAEGRPIFIDFTARWCVTCQFNKKSTLETKPVETAFDENNVAFLVADWTNRDEIIAAELARHNRAGVPLYLYYPPGGAEPVTLPQLLRPQIVIDTIETANAANTNG